ncbi:hypothetical protein SAMN04489864_105239 [Pedobacter insulae]|uniref:Uncharacterized protein n=1 Tax=Pedobacter insulae TaxID=414048 RepID=A0A1I2XKY1_9SPHI|nr:hypothetical protein SAMN04489864_105239 [Pedobacter insulae]
MDRAEMSGSFLFTIIKRNYAYSTGGDLYASK